MPLWKPLLFLVLGAATFMACRISPAYNSTLEAGLTLDLPYFVGDYAGIEQEVSEAEKTILPPDTEFARKIYQTLDGDTINCQIVLSGGTRRSIHRPEVCLPGQGWVISGSEVLEVPLSNQKPLKVTLLTLSREILKPDGNKVTIRSLFAYWFVGVNRTTHDHFERIFFSSWDLLTRNINHRWGYVIVSATPGEGIRADGKSYKETLDEMVNFIILISEVISKSH